MVYFLVEHLKTRLVLRKLNGDLHPIGAREGS